MVSDALQQTTTVSDARGVSAAHAGAGRLPELDSVRGLAAMTVVLLHFHDMWMPNDPAKLPLWQKALLMLLRPFYAGSEAVILFFVLSGLVLSLPYIRGRGQSYRRYITRRVLRIYGPYLAALILALCGAAIFHGHSYHGDWAARFWSKPLELRLIAQHLAFIGVYDSSQYDFVIWSLIQEMRISILFPLLIGVVSRIGGGIALCMGVVLSTIALAFVPMAPDASARYSLFTTLHYVAFFIVGIVVALNLQRIATWWKSMSMRARWAVACCSLFAYAYDWPIIRALMSISGHRADLADPHLLPMSQMMIAANWVSMFGTVGIIVVAINAAAARKLLKTPPALFLGRISYSLYLIHPVVLMALTFACGDRVSMWLQFPIYVVSALSVGWLLCRTVEEPFMKWSRAV